MWMRRSAVLTLVAVLVPALAGCTSGELYSLSLGGSMLQDESGTFKAGDSVRLSVAAGGTGTARVTLKDGDSAQVFSQTFGGSTTPGGAASGSGDCGSASGGSPGSGGSAYSCTIRGKAGTWSVSVDFSNYNGGFNLAITGA